MRASASICQARAISSNCAFLVRSRVRAAILRHSTTRSWYFGYFEHPPELSAKRTMLRRIRSVGRGAEQGTGCSRDCRGHINLLILSWTWASRGRAGRPFSVQRVSLVTPALLRSGGWFGGRSGDNVPRLGISQCPQMSERAPFARCPRRFCPLFHSEFAVQPPFRVSVAVCCDLVRIR